VRPKHFPGSAGGSPACKELVRVLREVGRLDDALAAQEKVVAAQPSVENRLLLAELQAERAATASLKLLAESAESAPGFAARAAWLAVELAGGALTGTCDH
jgi:hypothetical protein